MNKTSINIGDTIFIIGINAPAHGGEYWMKSESFTMSTPTPIDIAHLQAKWGY